MNRSGTGQRVGKWTGLFRHIDGSAHTTNARGNAMDTTTRTPRYHANGAAEPDPQQQSTGELIAGISEQTSRLVRAEIQLGLREMQEKGKRAGIGAGMFGAAGLLAFYGGAALVATAIAALALAIDTWLGALIVALVLFAAAAVAALAGKRQIKKATPPAPEQAIDGIKTDIATVREKVHRS
jgi:membrane protein implicated in regulation of membrane protease activity